MMLTVEGISRQYLLATLGSIAKAKKQTTDIKPVLADGLHFNKVKILFWGKKKHARFITGKL